MYNRHSHLLPELESLPKSSSTPGGPGSTPGWPNSFSFPLPFPLFFPISFFTLLFTSRLRLCSNVDCDSFLMVALWSRIQLYWPFPSFDGCWRAGKAGTPAFTRADDSMPDVELFHLAECREIHFIPGVVGRYVTRRVLLEQFSPLSLARFNRVNHLGQHVARRTISRIRLLFLLALPLLLTRLLDFDETLWTFAKKVISSESFSEKSSE